MQYQFMWAQIIAVAVASAVLAFALIIGKQYPIWETWYFIPVWDEFARGGPWLRSLFADRWGHVTIVPNAINLFVGYISGYSMKVDIVLTWLAALSAFVLMLRRVSDRTILIVAIAAGLFSIRNMEVWVSSWNLAWTLSLLWAVSIGVVISGRLTLARTGASQQIDDLQGSIDFLGSAGVRCDHQLDIKNMIIYMIIIWMNIMREIVLKKTATRFEVRSAPSEPAIPVPRLATPLVSGLAAESARAERECEPIWEAGSGDRDARAQRFREAALPYLDDVYTLARYLLRNSADAEDAAQECYLRSLKHFDSYRGPAMKPWLFAILRNVCRAEYARRSGTPAEMDEAEADDNVVPIWQELPPSPEAAIIRNLDAETIRKLVAQLPAPFREAIVMREINNLSYREIAEVVGVPVGTVMSRLARARCMLRQAWIAEDGLRP
jgi:RNA polymerase sigma-70 factor (ECF subfamily)